MTADIAEVPYRDERGLQGLAADWHQIYAVGDWRSMMARALQLSDPPLAAEQAMLEVASDLGLAIAQVVALDAPAKDTARQWRFADGNEPGALAFILPVAVDANRSAHAPGQLPISITRLGDELFLDSICDLVAIPVHGAGVPLSMTGLTLAVGRFASRERGELEIYATGMAWLHAHLARASALEAEMPAHLVHTQLAPPDHFCTLLLEARAIEWRPQIAWCAYGRDAKFVVVRDSLGMAEIISGLMRRKDPQPRLPKVFGPQARQA